MDEKTASRNKEAVSSDSENEDLKEEHGCASSYLVDERESSNSPLPQKFRERWSKAALVLAIVSLVAAVGFSVASFVMSQKTESSSVFAAGFDAFFAAVNVSAVCWRFRDELNGVIGPQREKIATTVIAVSFLLGGTATFVLSVYHLEEKDHPENADDMIIVLAVGFAMYSILASSQLHVSTLLKSSSMKALAVDSALGAAMSFGLMVSAWVYHRRGKLWFLDHVIASILGIVSLVYGFVLGCEVQEFNFKKHFTETFQGNFNSGRWDIFRPLRN